MQLKTYNDRKKFDSTKKAEEAAGFTVYRKIVEQGLDTRAIGFYPSTSMSLEDLKEAA